MVQISEVSQPAQGVGRDRGRRLARHVPLAQRRAAGQLGPGDLGTSGHGDAPGRGGVGLFAVAVVVGRRPARAAVHLHVLPQRRRVGVGFVAAGDAAVVGLVGGVHVRVLLPVRGVGEAPVAALVLALEGFFA